jgi:hypothetical protein
MNEFVSMGGGERIRVGWLRHVGWVDVARQDLRDLDRNFLDVALPHGVGKAHRGHEQRSLLFFRFATPGFGEAEDVINGNETFAQVFQSFALGHYKSIPPAARRPPRPVPWSMAREFS